MMAGTGNLDENDSITDINVTPFVDIMLVLLIIFMVTANYISQSAIDIKLPKAATGTESPATNLAFTLDNTSALFFDGEPITFEDIAARIQEAKESGKQLQALIAADQQTPHGTVIKLIDTIKKNGITDFAISIEVEESL